VPANLSPEYKVAEAAFRQAREPRERLEHLREMLRTIPKHKGTEHLQADIKARIKELSAELETTHKGGAHGGPALYVRHEGAAQIALLGPPNAGKSLLHARLTGSEAQSAPYPFTTQFPLPGMLQHEDVHFQLVDLPPVTHEHAVPWLASTLQTADAALLVADLSDPSCTDRIDDLHALLAERRVTLTERWPADESRAAKEQARDDDPFAQRLPALLLANKADRIGDVDAEVAAFRELTNVRYPSLAVSAQSGHGLGEIGPWLFARLGIVRVYTKLPGHAPDMQRPFTLRHGQTVRDVARLVHKDVERSLHHARLWGRSGFDGQQVGPDHVLADRDVVELHA
jgi:ribosome-interacting GTPase 1